MSFKFVVYILIIFIFENVHISTQEDVITNEDTDANDGVDYFELLFSEMRQLFHRKPDIYHIPPRGIISLSETKNASSDSTRIQLTVNNTYSGKVYKLNLTPVKHNVISDGWPVTKTWILHSSPELHPNYTYRVVDLGGSSIEGQFYEDVDEMALLLVNQKEGYKNYDGIVGETLSKQVVRPIPLSWNGTIYDANFEDHIVFKRSTGRNNVSRSKNIREPLDILYPKLVIVVDYSLYETLGSTSEVTQYIATYWNAVNLKYSLLKNPKVKIMVTSIIIAMDETALNCIYQAQRIANETHQKFELSNDVLSLCSAYFKQQFYKDTSFNNYDATIIMTGLKTRYLGLAYTGLICDRRHSLAYVHDDGDFLSVITATHELAHLLNILHDGEKDAVNCSTDVKYVTEDYAIGTIMSNPQSYAHNYFWSNCSIESLKNFTSKKEADCLKHSFRENKPSF